MSFGETDAEVLAAFEVPLPLAESDSNVRNVDGSTFSTNDCCVVNNVVGGLTSCYGLDELENCTVSECSDISCCEVRCNCDSSSPTHRMASNASQSHVTNKQRVTDAGVESVAGDTCQPTTEVSTSSVDVTQRRSAGRLLDKIKRTLQQNAKLDTPTRLNRLSAVVEKYDMSVADVTGADPFSGLPVKVKQLLETQRSITELYCE